MAGKMSGKSAKVRGRGAAKTPRRAKSARRGSHKQAAAKAARPRKPAHDILRFAQERIVELWDVGQPISKDSPNENGMF